MSARRVSAGPSSDQSGHGRRRIPPNFFSICIGLAGLADAWRGAVGLLGTPEQVADTLYAVAAVVWLALVIAYLGQGWRQVMADLRDPVLSPFVPLAVITPLILATALTTAAFTAARVLVVIFLVLTIAIGGWLTGQWIAGRLDLDSVHPGYFLPTVAGGLLGAFAAATVHLHAVAEASFGIGISCWLLLSSVLLGRLFFRPMLPAALVPTLAIEITPPVIAGIAYFEITGGRIDFIARALAGYAILMALVQLRFIPLYARLAFTPGFWAFTFAYAAAALDSLLWLTYTRPAGARAYGVCVLALITILLAGIAARTLVAIKRHEFFPPSGRA